MTLALISAFSAGAVSFLAPCSVPLLPAYVSFVAGTGGAGPLSAARLARGSLLYVLGFSAVFAVLGAVAGAVGPGLRDAGLPLQRIGGVLVVLLGLGLLGLGPRWSRGVRVPRAGGPLAPLALGLAFGTAWTPCAGPVLGGVLVLAAARGGAAQGAVLLLVYGLGIGLPFVVAGLLLAGSPRTLRALARVGGRLEKAAGALLVVLGLTLVTGTYGHVSSWLARFAPGAVP